MPRRLLLTLAACLAACSPNVGSRFVKSEDVDSRGAAITVSASDSQQLSGTRLEIPAGALAQSTRITLELGLESLAPAGRAAGPVAVWGPAGTKFSKPARMTLPLTASASSQAITVLVREADGRQFELSPALVTVESGRISFPTGGFTSFQPILVPTVACPADVFICPDGTEVGRSETNNCAFVCPSADAGEVICPADAMLCPDGTSVGRSGPNCEFVCPSADAGEVICPADAMLCPDGTQVGRSGPNCEFVCPPSQDGGPLACPADAALCPDGTQVGRSGPNCTFTCPTVDGGGGVGTPVVCSADAFVCPDGTEVGRSGPNCVFVCPARDGGP